MGKVHESRDDVLAGLCCTFAQATQESGAFRFASRYDLAFNRSDLREVYTLDRSMGISLDADR